MAGISKKNEGRISLALKPLTARGIRQLAYLADQSVNDYISKLLDSVVEKNQDVLQDFFAAESKARASVKTFDVEVIDSDVTGDADNVSKE